MSTKGTTKRINPTVSSGLTPDEQYAADLAELLSGRSYVLIGQRTCGPDGKSQNDYTWPQRGWASCNDWSKRAECGNGLHFCAVGAVGGEVVRDSGSTIIADEPDRRWQIVIARASESVRIDGEKHKALRVFVVDLDGSREAMTAWLDARGIVGHYITATAGDGGTATAGYRGTATAGDGGTARVRNNSRVKTGNNGIVVSEWFDRNSNHLVKAWTVGEKRDLKANTLYEIVDGVATEVQS